MSAITTHVLDTSRGMPATGVRVVLEYNKAGAWEEVGRSVTNDDGRTSSLAPDEIPPGEYRMTFETGEYFGDRDHFYPVVQIIFQYQTDGRHHHVPLLISPYGYSTYRGS